VIARGADDLFTISLDTSGELLHRRGYRSEDAGAPLRETLAAGLLQLAEWDGSTPLFDPTCGSGTVVIEAALLAAQRAPGRHRCFAFQSWPTYSPSLWEALLVAADTAARPLHPGLLYAADLDPQAIAVARRNAARAGVESLITWAVADLRRSHLPAGPPGLVLSNPPYGVRLRTPQRLYHELGRLARSVAGWHLGVLTTDPRLAHAAGPLPHRHSLFSGGLRVTLYLSGRAPAALLPFPVPTSSPK
jgi:putative N6-adenine-specific DNA methylase